MQRHARHHFTSWLACQVANIYFYFPTFLNCAIKTICAVNMLLLICSHIESLFVPWSGKGQEKQHCFSLIFEVLGHFKDTLLAPPCFPATMAVTLQRSSSTNAFMFYFNLCEWTRINYYFHWTLKPFCATGESTCCLHGSTGLQVV